METPTCRCCGKPMAKRTRSQFWAHAERPTREEARQRIANLGEITRFHVDDRDHKVMWVDYWDGKSWGYDDIFCTRTCGYNFGTMVARDLPHVQIRSRLDVPSTKPHL